MILTFLFSLYITIFCWGWGKITMDVFKKISFYQGEYSICFSLTCLIGLSSLSIIVGWYSLFFRLESIICHLIFLLPVAIFFTLKGKIQQFTKEIKSIPNIHLPLLILLFLCTLLILVLNAWYVTHPDTLGYHAQTIQWIEKYKVVPGLVNLNHRFGYQGTWYIMSAFFSFKFLEFEALTFINSAFVMWFLFFIVSETNASLRNKNYKSLLWLFLLIISFWSYTQIRLTVTSAHPDFIAAIFVWVIFYLFINKKHSDINQLLIISLCFVAVTIKLSSSIILLLSIFILFQFIVNSNLKLALLSCLLGIIILIPFFSRNIITSGYPLYPSTVLDIITTDWKYDKKLTNLDKNYIKAYARYPISFSEFEVMQALNMSFAKWINIWWQNRSLADKLLLISTFLSLAYLILCFKEIFKYKHIFVAVLIGIIGLTFWFLNAPDPRFGFGFIIPIQAIAFDHFLNSKQRIIGIYIKKTFNPFLFLISLVILFYTVYRLKNYFELHQIFKPAGIRSTAYKTIKCKGIEMNIPLGENYCNEITIPCIQDSCGKFIPRGINIEQGFKPTVKK